MWQGLLNKVFKIREKVALNLNKADEEKPFLDHLEDLRTMFVRSGLTLVIAVVLTFVFNRQLLDIIMIPYTWGMELAQQAAKEKEDEQQAEGGAPKADEQAKPEEKKTPPAAAADTTAKPEAQPNAQPPPHLASAQTGTTVVNIIFWVPGAPFPIVDTPAVKPAPPPPPPPETPPAEEQAESGLFAKLSARIESLAKKNDMPGTRTPQEGFMVCINVSLIAGVIVSFPLLLLFILQFVLPGLRDNEKGILFPALAIGFGLFLTGILFAYFAVLPRTLGFFASWNDDYGIKNTWMLGDYVSFATKFILIFGISFELPVVVMALVKLDFLSFKLMRTTRSYAVVAIAIFSALVTPTQDLLTLSLLAVPLYCLYEICIWLAYFMEKKERKLYPEFYAERDKDEAELEKEVKDDWDNEAYNPFGSGDDREDDDPDAYRRKEGGAAAPAPAGGIQPVASEETSSAEPPHDPPAESSGEPSAEAERQEPPPPKNSEDKDDSLAKNPD